MREYNSVYKFESGLRPYGTRNRRKEALVQCFNVVPRNKRLVAHEDVNAVSGLIMDWPYPQLFCLAGGNYLCGRDYIKVLDTNLDVVYTYTTTQAANAWSVVDFWSYVIFMNGAAVYVTDTVGGAIIPYTGTAIPVMKGITNFKGQLIGIGVTGYDGNVVVHGAIGAADFTTAFDHVEVGSVPMRWQGHCVAARRLGDRLIVYGDGGIAVLEAVGEPRLAFRHIDVLPNSIQHLGVVAVGGSEDMQCFLDETGCLWKISAQMEVTELGYSEYLASMLDGDVRISYDPSSTYRDFYISDGQRGYILTEAGLAEIHQYVASVQLYRGLLYGTFESSNDMSWTVETDLLDCNVRSIKSIEWIEVDGSGLVHAQATNGALSSLPFPLSPDGRARLRFTSSDFSFKLYGSPNTGVVLDSMRYAWRLADKTSVRGEYASDAVTRTTG